MTPVPGRRASQRVAWLLGALVAAPLSAVVPDPPQEYQASGALSATVEGPNCCGPTTFTGRFRTSYSLSSSGAVRITGLGFDLDDRDVVVRGGFLDLFSEVITIRCSAGTLQSPATGIRLSPTTLKLPPGSLQVAGGFSEGSAPDGSCADNGISYAGSNSADAILLHQPGLDHLELNAAFTAVLSDGATYVLRLRGNGQFDNRPPEAALGFRYPDGTYPQGGCPPVFPGPQGEPLTEANSPTGLVGWLFSNSGDPDGAGGRAGIVTDRWFDQGLSGPPIWLGDGRDAGPFSFGWSGTHTLGLLSFDHRGAPAVASCPSFRVADTRPPAVTPPPPLFTACSTAGGATPATSPPLAGFLVGAAASDLVDNSPSALAPRVGGVDVVASTLFPAGAARNVAFRFRDDQGNVGSATSQVTVVDTTAPDLALAVNRPSLAPDYKYWSIIVTPTMSDACGSPSLRLVSIRSNAPAHDAGDILDAVPGTDDRGFFLFSRPAGPGIDRFYEIVYEARDAAGNTRLAEIKVKVVASDASLGDLFAAYDTTLRTPKCATVGRSCDSGPALLLGRHSLGPEPNRPNTIASACADGTSGSFHADESNDRLKISTLDGTSFGPGKLARIEAVVFAYSAFASDHLDLYFAPNASSPTWTYLTTLTPTVSGPQVLSATYTLPAGTLQAVRARFRYNGSATACATGAYDDHDDLVFAVR